MRSLNRKQRLTVESSSNKENAGSICTQLSRLSVFLIPAWTTNRGRRSRPRSATSHHASCHDHIIITLPRACITYCESKCCPAHNCNLIQRSVSVFCSGYGLSRVTAYEAAETRGESSTARFLLVDNIERPKLGFDSVFGHSGTYSRWISAERDRAGGCVEADNPPNVCAAPCCKS